MGNTDKKTTDANAVSSTDLLCEHCGKTIPEYETVVDGEGAAMHKDCMEATCEPFLDHKVALELIGSSCDRALRAMDGRCHDEARAGMRSIRRLVKRAIVS